MTTVWPGVRDRLAEQLEDVGGGAGVEGAGRLVGEDHRGPGDQRAGDRDALLLAAGQFAGAVLAPVAEPDAVEDLAAPRRGSARRPASSQRQA